MNFFRLFLPLDSNDMMPLIAIPKTLNLLSEHQLRIYIVGVSGLCFGKAPIPQHFFPS